MQRAAFGPAIEGGPAGQAQPFESRTRAKQLARSSEGCK